VPLGAKRLAVTDGQGHNISVPVFVPVLWVSSVI